MTTKYYRKGQLVWKFFTDYPVHGAFVRIIGSTDGWTESVMSIDDMEDSNTQEITEEEGEMP